MLAADTVSPVGPMLSVTGEEYAEARAPSSVATAADGTLLVTWSQRDLEGSNGIDVRARVYGTDGSAAGESFIVNETTTGTQTTPAAAALPGGGFVVAWASSGTGADSGIWFRRYDSNLGPIGAETRAHAGVGARPSIAAMNSGGFVLTWAEPHPTVPTTWLCRARVFDSAGNALADAPAVVTENARVGVADGAPVVAAGVDGSFAVTWTATETSDDVFARVFNPDATPAGDATRVNLTTASTQNQPSIAALAGGGYVIAWAAEHEPTHNYHAVARRLSGTGSPLGGEIPAIEVFLIGAPSGPAVTATEDGGFVVAWTHADGVFARQFDSSGLPLTGDFAVTPPVKDIYWADRVTLSGNGAHLAAAWFDTDGRAGRLFAQRLQPAAPTIRGVLQPIANNPVPRVLTSGQPLAYSVSTLQLHLSERLSTAGGATGASSVTNLANWSMKIDGVDRSAWLDAVTLGGLNGAPLAIVTLKAPLPLGQFDLTLRDAVTDLSGKALDGDGNGIAGGDFHFALNVNAPAPLTPNQIGGRGDTPAVAALKGGGFVVVRDDPNLFARRYDASGNSAGNDVPVNVATQALGGFTSRRGPAVAALEDGGFVVTWTTWTFDAVANNYDTDVFARRFDASGMPVGDEFRLHAPTPFRDESNPAIAATSDGGFVAAWRATPLESDSGYDVFARRFNSSGAPAGEEFLVNLTTAGEQDQPAITGLPDGSVIVAWQSRLANLTSSVYARRFNLLTSAAGPEVLISSAAERASSPNVAHVLGGDVVVTYVASESESNTGVFVRRFSASLSPLGEQNRVNVNERGLQTEPAIAADPLGGFVVTWISRDSAMISWAPYARRFGTAGTSTGGEFRVSDSFESFPRGFAPALAIGDDGTAFFAWTQRGSFGPGNVTTRAFNLLPQAPWNGSPIRVGPGAAGVIQAEDFDLGGEGVSYHDQDPANLGGSQRLSHGVDVAATTDVGGGYAVVETRAGEWLEYTIDVATAGRYLFEARVASQGAGGKFHVEFDGVDRSGSIKVPNTRGWQSWTTVQKMVNLSAGRQVMRIVMDSAGSSGRIANFNWFKLQPRGPVTRAAPATMPMPTFADVKVDAKRELLVTI